MQLKIITSNVLCHWHDDTKEGKDGCPDIYENVTWEIIK